MYGHRSRDTSAPRHFGTGAEVVSLKHFGIGAEMSGHFGTGAELSVRHFGTGAEMSETHIVRDTRGVDRNPFGHIALTH